MKDEDFKKATNLKEEIKEISNFIYYCENNWLNLRIKKIQKNLKLHTAYGCMSDELIASEELAKRVLKTIEEYKSELEKEFDSI